MLSRPFLVDPAPALCAIVALPLVTPVHSPYTVHRTPLTKCDLLDNNSREILSVANLLAPGLAPAIVKRDGLGSPTLLHHLADHPCALHKRRADVELLAVMRQHHPVYHVFAAGRRLQTIHV